MLLKQRGSLKHVILALASSVLGNPDHAPAVGRPSDGGQYCVGTDDRTSLPFPLTLSVFLVDLDDLV